jgi:hypothetical protein
LLIRIFVWAAGGSGGMAVDMRGIVENVCLVYVLEDLLKPKVDETFAGVDLDEYLKECRRARDHRASELTGFVSDASGNDPEAEAKLRVFPMSPIWWRGMSYRDTPMGRLSPETP